MLLHKLTYEFDRKERNTISHFSFEIGATVLLKVLGTYNGEMVLLLNEEEMKKNHGSRFIKCGCF